MGLGNVFPEDTVNNPIYLILTNTKDFTNSFLSPTELPVKVAYLAHLIFSEFMRSVALAAGRAMLANSILNIVKVSAKEKVTEIYAGAIITAMQNVESLWNRTVMYFIRYAVGCYSIAK